jgi:hypothetical protein
VNFFQYLLRGISLQHYEEHEVDRFILDNYKRMISIYQEQKKLLPSEHLIELSYEDMIQNPEKTLSEVTGRLGLGVKADIASVKDYLAASKDFPLNNYQFGNDFLNEVNNTLGDLIGLQGYRIRKTNLEEQMKS